jgi:hypothetical protein
VAAYILSDDRTVGGKPIQQKIQDDNVRKVDTIPRIQIKKGFDGISRNIDKKRVQEYFWRVRWKSGSRNFDKFEVRFGE